MARARNIKPSLFMNEVLGTADPLYTILFEGLWCLADREGRLEDRPLRIKAEILPYRDGINSDVLLNWLKEKGFIIRYDVDNVRYIQIVNFVKHQNPHKNENDSKIPPVPTDYKKPLSNNELNNTGTKPEGVPNKSEPRPNNSEPLVLIPDSLNLIPDSNTPPIIPPQGGTPPDNTPPQGDPPKEKPKKPKPDEVEEVNAAIDGYTQDAELRKSLKQWAEDRKARKKPLTLNALNLAFNVLNEAANDVDRVKIVQKSILGGYQGLFPLDNQARSSPPGQPHKVKHSGFTPEYYRQDAGDRT